MSANGGAMRAYLALFDSALHDLRDMHWAWYHPATFAPIARSVLLIRGCSEVGRGTADEGKRHTLGRICLGRPRVVLLVSPVRCGARFARPARKISDANIVLPPR